MKIYLPKEKLNGGCGELVYVTGTNGGRMPCGCLLKCFGETKPFYCPGCQEKNHESKTRNQD